MNKDIVLTELQIDEIKKTADKERRKFGIIDAPIAGDLFMLLEQEGIAICQYPFLTSEKSHTDANITRFETGSDQMIFIGLNTAIYHDEQIFALAHELYHYITQTGKAYETDMDEEDKRTEKMADRFAAELLLPSEILNHMIIEQFKTSCLKKVSDLRLLRFIARLQSEWWLPYRALVLRLNEEKYITDEQVDTLFGIDDRDKESIYGKIFFSIAPDCYTKLNTITRRTDVSNWVLEIFIMNFEDGSLTEDEFVKLLNLFGKRPDDFGFDLIVDDSDLDELNELFESGDIDEG